MINDLTLPDDNDGRPAPTPGFTVSEPSNDRELTIEERCHRESAKLYPGAGVVMFVKEDPDTGEEVFDDVQLPVNNGGSTVRVTEGQKWQALMGWPRIPTVAEVEAFQARANAMAASRLWYELEEEAPAGPEPRPGGADATRGA